MSRVKILVVTGSSGGHIFPALGFIEAFEEKALAADLLLVLPKRSAIREFCLASCRVKYISTLPMSMRPDLKNLKGIFALLKGSLQSLFILIEFMPDAVVGFGTLDCLPMVLFAWAFRIKTVIHEQNVLPGQANKLLAKFADRVALSFRKTADYLSVSADNTVFVGNPLRKLESVDKKEALSFFGLEPGRFTVLVMGGSQGSHNINTAFLEAARGFAPGGRIQAIHLCGRQDFVFLQGAYHSIKADIKAVDFLKPMQYAYSACDLVVCRAGATTVAELIKFKVPAIMIPYPFAHQHQAVNAALLRDSGSAVVIEDSKLDGDTLRDCLQRFVDDPEKIKQMSVSYDKLSCRGDAAALLADAVLSLAAGKEAH
jgi:UDP-N-acetylglucosamine--N-acetylmuramyl-(pentapeptide) pyrophosphoryl-undecaprenol N-acetylglucosamine transferase